MLPVLYISNKKEDVMIWYFIFSLVQMKMVVYSVMLCYKTLLANERKWQRTCRY